MDQAKKKERSRLRSLDVAQNLERERRQKQEFQDYVLKQEFQKNAMTQENNYLSETMVGKTKAETRFVERDAVVHSVPYREMKKKKTDAILSEVRNKKLAELAQYKNKAPDRKYEDIQRLLGLMQDVGVKVPALGKKDAPGQSTN